MVMSNARPNPKLTKKTLNFFCVWKSLNQLTQLKNTWKSFNTWNRLKRKCRLLSSTWLIRLLSEKENSIQTDLSFPDEIHLLGRIRHSWETKMKSSKKQSPSMMQKCGKSRFLKIKNKSKSLVKSSLAQIKKTKVWQTLNSFPYPTSKPISS